MEIKLKIILDCHKLIKFINLIIRLIKFSNYTEVKNSFTQMSFGFYYVCQYIDHCVYNKNCLKV